MFVCCLFQPFSSTKKDRRARKYPLKQQWCELVEVNEINSTHPRRVSKGSDRSTQNNNLVDYCQVIVGLTGGVARLFKGRQCGRKLKSGLRKFGLFVSEGNFCSTFPSAYCLAKFHSLFWAKQLSCKYEVQETEAKQDQSKMDWEVKFITAILSAYQYFLS